MVYLTDDFQETHTWSYLLLVYPWVQTDIDQYDNWATALLQKGFCWRQKDLILDVTFIEHEERQELEAWLQVHGLHHSVEQYCT